MRHHLQPAAATATVTVTTGGGIRSSNSSISVGNGAGGIRATVEPNALRILGPGGVGAAVATATTNGSTTSAHRFADEGGVGAGGRSVKFVANAYNHIPSAVQYAQTGRINNHSPGGGAVVTGATTPAASGQNRRTYATIPLTRPSHSAGPFVKETGHGYASSGGGGSFGGKTHLYCNMSYATTSNSVGGVRGHKVEFKDRNVFVHNNSNWSTYVATSGASTGATNTANAGGPVKRSLIEAGPRFSHGAPKGISGNGGGAQSGGNYRQQYSLVSNTMTSP